MTREPSRLRGWHGMALGSGWGPDWHGLAGLVWLALYGLVFRHQSTPVGHVGVAVRRTIAANMLSRINAR